MRRKKCFDNDNEDVVDTMGFGAEMSDDHWRHPEEYNQYGILSWMTSELVSMIRTLLYVSTSAENEKYVSKIGSKFVPNLQFFFLRGCLCLWLHQEILLFSEYQLSSWEALTSFFWRFNCWKSWLYCTSNAVTSGFFWTKYLKWWFFFVLKMSKWLWIHLDFSISEEENERMFWFR